MCPCDSSIHLLCDACRRAIANDVIRLAEAVADGRGYDADIRALRGRLADMGWGRELVERDLKYGGREYARTGVMPAGSPR